MFVSSPFAIQLIPVFANVVSCIVDADSEGIILHISRSV